MTLPLETVQTEDMSYPADDPWNLWILNVQNAEGIRRDVTASYYIHGDMQTWQLYLWRLYNLVKEEIIIHIHKVDKQWGIEAPRHNVIGIHRYKLSKKWTRSMELSAWWDNECIIFLGGRGSDLVQIWSREVVHMTVGGMGFGAWRLIFH